VCSVVSFSLLENYMRSSRFAKIPKKSEISKKKRGTIINFLPLIIDVTEV